MPSCWTYAAHAKAPCKHSEHTGEFRISVNNPRGPSTLSGRHNTLHGSALIRLHLPPPRHDSEIEPELSSNRKASYDSQENDVPKTNESPFTRKQLIDALNEDLSREYQAIISYVNYSQVLKGAAYMNIAGELEVHARQELDHALKVSNAIDYLGGMPSVTPKAVKTSE